LQEDSQVRTAKIVTSLIFIMILSGLIWATTPQLINYQGRLFDSSGEPLTDGSYDISFTIYDAPTGGAVKWSESQTSVALTDGLFNVVMGSVVALADSVFDGTDRYLEISVQGQIITPRSQFTSVGYAHRISTIDGATAGELSGSLKLYPNQFDSAGNAITVMGINNTPVFDVSVDAFGYSNVSFYEPVDAKDANFADLNKVLDFAVDPAGGASISFFEPVDSKSGLFGASLKSMEISVDALGVGSINFFEPVDSKSGLDGAETPVVAINKNGLVMFGAADQDTSLYVASNGDIVGLGQITMGENSSDGVQTSVLGFDNDASGDSSSIGGGSFNVAAGEISVIGGGFSNTGGGTGVTIGGGAVNNATGQYATISGGLNNTAMGDFSTIPGGHDNVANGDYSYSAGHRAIAGHSGVFVWADQTDADFMSTGTDQFIIRAGGGVGIGTNSPIGILDVVGYSGDSAVNFPDDAISSPEIFDEPGIAAERGTLEVTLIQGFSSFEDLVTTTITIPSAGYIMVTGGGTFESYGTSKANQALVQIDQYSGGGPESPYYLIVGTGDQDTPSNLHYFSINAQRVFYMPSAGTYDFRLEAQASPDNGSGAVSKVMHPYITAVYFPTSYGTVNSFSNSR
jgi:hypothetical protein